jgi:SAM-dependent methyltransferase/acyl carrier protein
LRRRSNPAAVEADDEDYAIAAQIVRHNVSHLQCTPSLLGLLAMDEEAVTALSRLRMLLVGGEALPPALVDRLAPHVRGSWRNMYGPTETTIWSTTSTVESGTPITIGKPIANTQVHIVDKRLRRVPLDVPGELVIGGAGVVRGYLARPELTADRFVADPFGSHGDRLYRTGDLARWLSSGDIEFVGRLDHQIKIRGYRIELGEIEAVLAEHPAVRESVVVARDGAAGDARLIAYVVPGRSSARSSGEGAGAAEWEAIWDETYSNAPAAAGSFNTAGWNSSFTGAAIPPAEMQEWVEATTERILAAARDVTPDPRVLEIGCGTGMLLFRVAPHVKEYVGVDFSAAALRHVQAHLEPAGLQNVKLEHLRADQLGMLQAPGAFDLIVLNSVIQYFPDVDYLQQVLKAAYERLAPGGRLFVGDVRSLAHLEAFHTAIELARADEGIATADLRARVQRRATDEGELVLDPRFFDALAATLGNAVVERTELKAGRAHNEMTAFRYDAVIRKNAGNVGEQDDVPTIGAARNSTAETLAALLRDGPAALRVTGIPNARLVDHVAAARRLASGDAGATAGQLRSATASIPSGMHPDDLRQLHPEYDADVTFAADDPASMDVVFRRRGTAAAGRGLRGRAAPDQPASAYANTPARRQTATGNALMTELRQHTRQKLPEYMVPSAFVLLDAMPLTPNGKIDRAQLPAPERPRSEATSTQPPSNSVEHAIVGVLKELLGADEIGVEDNFFDLGANSLILVQASIRLRAVLGRAVPLVQLFQFPTARALAESLGTDEKAADAGVKQSQDRAQLRREAMQRRGAARPRVTPDRGGSA